MQLVPSGHDISEQRSGGGEHTPSSSTQYLDEHTHLPVSVSTIHVYNITYKRVDSNDFGFGNSADSFMFISIVTTPRSLHPGHYTPVATPRSLHPGHYTQVAYVRMNSHYTPVAYVHINSHYTPVAYVHINSHYTPVVTPPR